MFLLQYLVPGELVGYVEGSRAYSLQLVIYVFV